MAIRMTGFCISGVNVAYFHYRIGLLLGNGFVTLLGFEYLHTSSAKVESADRISHNH